MPRPKGGLGRGLGALIPQGQGAIEPAPQDADLQVVELVIVEPVQAEAAPQRGLLDLPVDSISPNPRQPRTEMPPEALDELADSIREHGVIQPIVVTGSTEPGSYTLIAGERRWRAAVLAGLGTIPAIVKEATPREMLEWALIENLQRSDLNPLEEAAAYRSLVEEFGLTQEDVAGRIGKSRQSITNSLRLLRLPLAVQQSLALGLISEGHARAILQVPSEDEQLRLLEHTVAEGLNVRQVEALARRLAERAEQGKQGEQGEARSEGESPKREVPLYDEVRALEDRFRDALGTKVQLSKSRRGGKLVIYFYNDEELGRIYGAIVGEE